MICRLPSLTLKLNINIDIAMRKINKSRIQNGDQKNKSHKLIRMIKYKIP